MTLKDLAAAAGVSLASASYAINGSGSLGDATRAHILKVAEEIGYRQNMSARAMRTGRTGALGLIMPDLSNEFFPALAQAVIQEARRRDYHVFVVDTQGSEEIERETLGKLIERGVDGLIWFPIRDGNRVGKIIESVPTIVLDRTLPGIDSIHADYAEGGRLAADHLLEMGHRRIGIVSGPTDILSMRQRCEAAAMTIRARAELVYHLPNAFTLDLEPAVRAAIDSGEATAVFAGADVIALGVLRYAETIGLRVPDDLSIVGFDDIPWSSLAKPALTTVDMPLEAMAAEAVEAVIRRMEQPTHEPRRTVFGVTLIQRASVRPLAI